MELKPDTAVRAITDDGAFRVVAIQTTHTVGEAVAAQHAQGQVARMYADLLTCTVLVRETMAPELRVQGILQSDDHTSRMVADTHEDGGTRGLVQLATGKTSLDLGANSVLQMMRTLHNGSIHQGVVLAGPEGGMSAALMNYMQSSEQVVSVAAVGAVDRSNGSMVAGGYLVQLLPEVGDGPLAAMTERLQSFTSIDELLIGQGSDPTALLASILDGFPYTIVGQRSLSFRCRCSETRLTASLSTLPRADIEEFIHDGKLLEITCDYCGKDYRIAPESLRGLLSTN